MHWEISSSTGAERRVRTVQGVQKEAVLVYLDVSHDVQSASIVTLWQQQAERLLTLFHMLHNLAHVRQLESAISDYIH